MYKQFLSASIFFVLISFSVIAQENDQVMISDSSYILYKEYDLPASPVKDQNRTGTCWDFATVSFLESEILRKQDREMDLSEMYIVRETYPDKAELYVRNHGKANFGQGGQAHDAIYALKHYGLMPEQAYRGLNYGTDEHNHGEMVAVLDGMLENVIRKYNGSLTPAWDDAVEAVLDVYLGKVPEKFEYDNREFSPESFAEYTGLNAEDYIEFTSYNHHPFYEKVNLEVPDNWANDSYYNVPLDDLIKIIENSFKEGYTVVWDGDVSDLYFSHKNGLALVPERSTDPDHDPNQDSTYQVPRPQRKIDQEERQKVFDQQTSTDDHLMHLTGIYKDKLGEHYYKTKNSWGKKSNKFGGYLYMSEPYIRLNTIAIMVNKKAVPNDLAKKLGIK